MIIFLSLFFLVVFGFTFIVHEVLSEREDVVDFRIFRFLAAHVITPDLTSVMKAVTYFASATFLQVAYALLFLTYLLLKNTKRAFEIIVVGVGGFIVNYFMKLSFHRPRPVNPLVDPLANFSFPSGHATSGFIFYGLLAYLIWKTELAKPIKYAIGCLLVGFSLLIGFSRMYLRVHYPSDVAAGVCIGFAWLLLTIYFMEKLKKKADREQKELVTHPNAT
ncbi:phosphatase PAP2 family protein [Flaviaesturariibacter flavus]|nr:phosphatase PAP2 family protein [Flaviaesturariibacter flavus]